MKIRIFVAFCLWLGVSLAAMEPVPMEVENKENKVDKKKWIYALRRRNVKKVEELLKLGANPNEWLDIEIATSGMKVATSAKCMRPLHVALLSRDKYGGYSFKLDVPLLSLLLRHNANPNIFFRIASWEKTALPLAYLVYSLGVRKQYDLFSKKEEENILEGITLLLRYDADPCKADVWGYSAMGIAKSYRLHELLSLFADARRKLKAKRIALCATLTKGPIPLPREIAKIIIDDRYPFSKDNSK